MIRTRDAGSSPEHQMFHADFKVRDLVNLCLGIRDATSTLTATP